MEKEEIKVRCWWCGEESIPLEVNTGFEDSRIVKCPLCRARNMIKQFGQGIETIAATDPLTSIW